MTGGRGHGSLWLGPAPPPAPWPSPLPAPEHVALTIYGAAAAAVREPGSPGAAATKAEEARRGRRRPPGRVRTPSHLCRSRPAGERGRQKGGSRNPGSPTPSQGFHLRPGVCGGGEPDQHSPFPPTPALPASPRLRLLLGMWGCPDGGEPGAPHLCALHSLPDSSGAGGGRVSLGEGDELDRAEESAPSAPQSSPSPAPGGGGAVSPPPRFPWEARGASLAHPHPQSDTPGARRERGGGAEPQTTKSRAGERRPLPREVGGRGRPALPVPSREASLFAPESPLGVRSQKQWRCCCLGRCDSDPHVPRDPPRTHRHSEAARVIHTAPRRGGEDKGSKD